MTSPALPSALDSLIATLREKLEFAAQNDQGYMQFTTLFLRDLADTLEVARDALAGQSEPPKFGEGPVIPRVLLAPDDVIRNSLPGDHILGRVTELEKMVFFTTLSNPEQGEALRAFLEGRPAVPVVTP